MSKDLSKACSALVDIINIEIYMKICEIMKLNAKLYTKEFPIETMMKIKSKDAHKV